MLAKCIAELTQALINFGYYTYNGYTSLGQVPQDDYNKGAVLIVLGNEITLEETTVSYLTNEISIVFLISVQGNEDTFLIDYANAQTEFKKFINDYVYLDCEAMEFEYASSDPFVDKGGLGSYGGCAVTTTLRYRQLKADPENK